MKLRLVALIGVCCAGLAHADAFVKGPYVQDVQGDQAVIMWQSDAVTGGRITVRGAGAAQVVDAPPATLHEVVIHGLVGGKRYEYAVESGGQSTVGELRTPAAPDQPFAFVVFGDTRSNAEAHRALVDRVRGEVPDFILITGDLVDDGVKEADWQTFFSVERDLLRENVVFPTVGNHDRQGSARSADAFRRYFALPVEGSPAPERCYALTWGNARILVVDSNETGQALAAETAWLERELAAAVADPHVAHRFVMMHHPMYSVSLHGGQPELRAAWTPLFERYAVDAVFSGHDHVYARAEKNGVRYFVSGGGGAPLYPRDPRAAAVDVEATRYFERTSHYLRVQVAGAFVEVSAVREDGTLIETMRWRSAGRK